MGDTNVLRSSDYAALSNGVNASGLVGKPAAAAAAGGSDIQVPAGYAPAQPPAGYAYPGSGSANPQGPSIYSSSLPPMMGVGANGNANANGNGAGVGVGVGYAPPYLSSSSSTSTYPSAAFPDLGAVTNSHALASNAGRFAATSNPARRQQQDAEQGGNGGTDSDAPSGGDEGTSPNTGTSSGHVDGSGNGNGSTPGGNGGNAGGESAAAKKKREKEEKDKRLKTSRACDGCRTRKIRWVGISSARKKSWKSSSRLSHERKLMGHAFLKSAHAIRCDVIPDTNPPLCVHCKHHNFDCTWVSPLRHIRGQAE